MKVRFIFITLLLFVFSIVNVYAENDYKLMTLIPKEEKVSISTKSFDYRNISFNSKVSGKKYARIDIDSVLNKTGSVKPLSIDILLFNSKQQNIGYISFCSTKDLSSDYSNVTLSPDTRSILTIPIENSYLVSGYKTKDIVYYAILGDNTECVAKDVNKYAGLTIFDIRSGKINPNYHKLNLSYVVNTFINLGLIPFLLILLFISSIYVAISMMINHLSKSMFEKPSYIAWIPVFHGVASVRVAFGKIMAIIFALLLFIAIIMVCIMGNSSLLIVVLILMFISIFINIIKCVSGNYGLLYFDPSTSYTWQHKLIKANNSTEVNYNDQVPVSNTVIDQQQTPSQVTNNVTPSLDNNMASQVPSISIPTQAPVAAAQTVESVPETAPIVLDDVDNSQDDYIE